MQASIHYFCQEDKPLGLPLSDLCLNETKEPPPPVEDQSRWAEGDSVDDVSTLGAPCRCLAHIGCGQGFEGE